MSGGARPSTKISTLETSLIITLKSTALSSTILKTSANISTTYWPSSATQNTTVAQSLSPSLTVPTTVTKTTHVLATSSDQSNAPGKKISPTPTMSAFSGSIGTTKSGNPTTPEKTIEKKTQTEDVLGMSVTSGMFNAVSIVNKLEVLVLKRQSLETDVSRN